MSYLKDREIWLSSVPTGNPPAGYVWVFIQNGVFVVRDSSGVDKIMASTTGTVTNATSASYVEYSNVANKPTLISGSSQVSYTGLSNVPAGIVSGSSQVSFNGIADKPTLVSGSSQVTYSGLTGVPAGIVSSSAQVGGYGIFATTGSNQFNGSQAVTGSLTVTGQVVAQTLNVQQVTSSIVYSSGSNVFGNSLSNTQQFTGSVSVTGSLTVNGAGTFASSITAATLSTIGTAVAGQNVQLNLNGVSGKAQRIEFQNSGVQQWLIGAGAANETNNFEIYNSNGQMALSFAKSTSAATFANSITAGAGINSIGPEQAFTWQRTTGTSSDVYSINADSGAAYLINNTTSNILTYWREGGNVGIGVFPTNSKLLVAGTHVSGNSILGVVPVGNQTATIGLYNSSNVRTGLLYSDTGFVRLETDADQLQLSSAGNIALTIATNGNSTFSRNVTIQSAYALFVNNSDNTRSGFLETNSSGTLLSSFNGAGEPLLLQAPHSSATIRFIVNGNSSTGERMRITSSGRVGIKNSDPQGMLETGIVANNTTQGGHFFSTFQVPLNTWTTVFYAPNNNWNAITEFTWVSSADYNRSGAAYMRWAYNGGAAALGVVYTLFNDSQNSTATFRNSGGEIQILITGGASDYYVQVRIQGSKAA